MAIKTLANLKKQEQYRIPANVRDVIPIKKIWTDGMIQTGGMYAKSWKFTDINYMVASHEDKESMFLTYS